MKGEKMKTERMKDMKKVMMLMVLCALMAYLIPAQAQTFQTITAEKNAIQSQQMVNSGVQYKGTVYEPFSNVVPSEQSEVGASYSPAKAPSGPRRAKMGDFDDSPEGGEGSGDSPIGDAVWPLMLMAIAFGGAVYLRRRREA